jgi:hypothetical protein
MTKYGIGVGNEFPVDESHNPPPPENDDERWERRRRWHRYRFFRLLMWAGLITLIVCAIACPFQPHYFYPGPIAPYTYYPYPYSYHFLFSFIPVLLVAVLIAFAWRRGGYCMRRHWRDESRDDRRAGA